MGHTGEDAVSKRQAKAIALSHAGVNAANVFDMKAEQQPLKEVNKYHFPLLFSITYPTFAVLHISTTLIKL